MINPFVIKKWAALLIAGLFPTIGFAIGIRVTGNYLIGLGIMFVFLVLTVPISNLMIKNPFSSMLEGKGILAMDITSTGIIRPFVLGVDNPYIKGKLEKDVIEDVFNRNTIANIKPPKAGKPVKMAEGKIAFELDQDEFNNARMGMLQYPVILYNSIIKSVITKEMLSDKEKNSFAEHQLIYLNNKNQELSSHIRDFGRAVVEHLRPKQSIWSNWITWVVLGIIVFALGAMFLPLILDAIQGFGGSAPVRAIQSAANAGGSTVVPR